MGRMGELWENRLRIHIDIHNLKVREFKDNKTILILGSYHPKPLKKLENVKKEMLKDGYNGVVLVSDIDFGSTERGIGRKLDDLEKSVHAINTADIIILIFFNDCDNASVMIEANYIIKNPGNNIQKTIFLNEKNALRALPRDLFKNFTLKCIEIDDFIDIKKILDKRLYDMVLGI